MKPWILPLLPGFFALCVAMVSYAAPMDKTFGFMVIGERSSSDDGKLIETIKDAGHKQTSFIVVNGIRPQNESCSDSLYQRRKKLLDEAEKPLIVTLSARDWAECKNENGESSAQERLNYLRSMLLDDGQVAQAKKIQLVRQSSTVKFRNYSENIRWESRGVLFSTINLPANNNNYLAAAGRNNEFEDRLIANRNWLQRVFTHARSSKMKGIVLFVDGNPLATPARSNRTERRDGFIEVRKQLIGLAAKFPGKVLLIHGQPSSSNIVWRDNLGVVGAGSASVEFTVHPGSSGLFTFRYNKTFIRK